MRPSDKISSKYCVLFPQPFAIYNAFAFLFEENLCQICICNNKKCWSKRLLLRCIQHQNALQFAPKRKAFSTKAQTKDIKIGCKGLFINKLALKDEKRLGGFWRSTQLCPAPQLYAKKPCFALCFSQIAVNHVVINLKNTRQISPHAQRFYGEGTHNVKAWCKYFTFLWLLFRTIEWFWRYAQVGLLQPVPVLLDCRHVACLITPLGLWRAFVGEAHNSLPSFPSKVSTKR